MNDIYDELDAKMERYKKDYKEGNYCYFIVGHAVNSGTNTSRYSAEKNAGIQNANYLGKTQGTKVNCKELKQTYAKYKERTMAAILYGCN